MAVMVKNKFCYLNCFNLKKIQKFRKTIWKMVETVDASNEWNESNQIASNGFKICKTKAYCTENANNTAEHKSCVSCDTWHQWPFGGDQGQDTSIEENSHQLAARETIVDGCCTTIGPSSVL